jgi:hypothetical protein
MRSTPPGKAWLTIIKVIKGLLPLYRYLEKLYPARAEIRVEKTLEMIETIMEFFKKTRNFELVITFTKFSSVGSVKKLIRKMSPGFFNAVFISHNWGKKINIPIVMRKNQKKT